MTTSKFKSIALAALMVLSVVAVASPASAATSTTVSVDPGSQSVDVGNTVQYDIVVDSVDNGIASYEFDASVGDAGTAMITDVSLQGTSADDTLTTVEYADDNSNVSVAAGSAGHDAGVIATVTVEGVAAGETDLSLSGVAVGDNDASSYTIDGTNAGTVSVTESPEAGTVSGTVTDADGNAIEGAAVNVQGADLSATTDANGEYTIADAPEGTHTLEVSADGYVTETADVSVTAGETTTQNFDLEEPVSIGVTPSEVGTIFQGEQLVVDVSDTSVGSGDILQIREGLIGEGDSTLAATAEVNESGIATFSGDDTDELAAEGVDRYHFFRANGENIDETQFEVTLQDLEAGAYNMPYYGDEAAYTDNGVTISSDNIDLAGGSFDVAVNSTSLDQDQMLAAFGDAASAHGDHKIALTVASEESSFGVDFSDLDFDTYNFSVESQVSSAEASFSIEYTEAADVSGSISDTTSAVRGDVASFTVDLQNTDTAEVQVADLAGNYQANLTVQDASDDSDSDDGQVTVHMNTYLAGHSDDAFSVVGENDQVTVNDQTEISDDFQLAAAGYNVQLNLNGDQADSAALDVIDRSPSADSITAMTAPAGDDFDSVEAITSNGTQTDWATFGEHLAFEVEASGIFGYLNDDVDAEGLSLTLAQENYDGAYSNAPSFNVSGSAFDIVEDSANDRFFVTVDTDALQNAEDLSDGDEYSVTFEIDGENNAYLGDDVTESVETMVTFEDPEVSFGTVEAPYQVLAEDGAEVRGSSTYAPGTELEIRASGGDIPTFQRYVNAVVQDDGSWTAEFDFSDRSVDEEFTLRVIGESTTVDAVLSDTAEWETSGASEELQQRVSELETLLNETMDELEDKNTTIEELRTELNETGGASQELLEQKNATISELENQTESLNQQLAQAESDLLNSTTEMADLNEEINALNLTVRTLEAENADLQNQTESLQSMLEERNSTVEEQQSTIDERDSTISELEDEVSSLEEELAAAEETTTASGPGFTAVLALVALMGAALLAVRRQQ